MQILESVDRNPRRASRELEQAGFALRRPAADALPEPLDDFVVELVTTVVSELSPVVTVLDILVFACARICSGGGGGEEYLHINLGHSTNEEL